MNRNEIVADTGGIDDKVDAPDRRDSLGDHALGIRLVGDVAARRRGRAGPPHGLRKLLSVPVRKNDRRAKLDQQPGRLLADAARPARDERISADKRDRRRPHASGSAPSSAPGLK